MLHITYSNNLFIKILYRRSVKFRCVYMKVLTVLYCNLMHINNLNIFFFKKYILFYFFFYSGFFIYLLFDSLLMHCYFNDSIKFNNDTRDMKFCFLTNKNLLNNLLKYIQFKFLSGIFKFNFIFTNCDTSIYCCGDTYIYNLIFELIFNNDAIIAYFLFYISLLIIKELYIILYLVILSCFKLLFMYLIKKKKNIGNGTQRVSYISAYCRFFLICKHLINKKRSSFGRSIFVGRLIYSKGISLKFKFFYLNFYLNYFNYFFCILNFFFDLRRSSFLSLIILPFGGWMYFLCISSWKLYNFILLPSFALFNIYKFIIVGKNSKCVSTNFYFMKPYSYISCLSSSKLLKVIYVRAAGVCARLIRKDFSRNQCLVLLPSGLYKIFNIYCFCAGGFVEPREHNKLFSTKAGWWRLRGCAPIVRGVAKNPVDHPHGGNTNTIRYPRTPWGKTTKFK